MSKPYSREQMIEAVKRAYPKQHIRTSEEFSPNMIDGLWLAADGGTEDKRGAELFNYYAESSLYEMGVIAHLAAWANRHGWYFEYYDPGTIFMWEN
jgi:hypothetical protein